MYGTRHLSLGELRRCRSRGVIRFLYWIVMRARSHSHNSYLSLLTNNYYYVIIYYLSIYIVKHLL